MNGRLAVSGICREGAKALIFGSRKGRGSCLQAANRRSAGKQGKGASLRGEMGAGSKSIERNRPGIKDPRPHRAKGRSERS